MVLPGTAEIRKVRLFCFQVLYDKGIAICIFFRANRNIGKASCIFSPVKKLLGQQLVISSGNRKQGIGIFIS